MVDRLIFPCNLLFFPYSLKYLSQNTLHAMVPGSRSFLTNACIDNVWHFPLNGTVTKIL